MNPEAMLEKMLYLGDYCLLAAPNIQDFCRMTMN